MTIGVVWSFDRRKVLLFLLAILPLFNLTVAAAASFLAILLGRVLRA
jgi:predicted MFS family arabinose efflux permease